MLASARLLALVAALATSAVLLPLPAAGQTTAPAPGAPAIEGLEVNADAAFLPGSTLEFSVLATPRAAVRVQVADSAIDLQLQERRPGVYTGSYTVRRGDRLDARSLIRARATAQGRSADAEFRFPRSFAEAQATAPVVTPLPPVGAPPAASGPVQPPPPPAAAVRIDRFEATPVARNEPGAQLRFLVEGVPNATVTVPWPGLQGALLLREQQPGRYVGTYTLRAQDSVGLGPAVATLSSGGRRVTAQLATPLVAARPEPAPAAPAGMGAAAATAVPVQLTSPLPNAVVDASQVVLQGRTAPGALVHVRVDAIPPAPPGRASVARQLVQQTVQADANGVFTLTLGPQATPPGTRLEVQFSATHGATTSPEQRITLFQRQG